MYFLLLVKMTQYRLDLAAVVRVLLSVSVYLLLNSAVGYQTVLLLKKKKQKEEIEEIPQERDQRNCLKAQSKIILPASKYNKTSTTSQRALLYLSQIYF